MPEITLEYNLTSCYEETQPPTDARFTGTDGVLLLSARFVEPTWRQVQDCSRTMPEGLPDEERDAHWAALCVESWSLTVPVSAAEILKLTYPIQTAFAKIVLGILQVKQAQVKNSNPLSQPSGSPTSNGGAESSTKLEVIDSPQVS